AGWGRRGAPGPHRRRRLRLRVARGAGRDAFAARHAALGGDRELRRRRGTARKGGAALPGRLYRQPLAARGVRYGRLRLLPNANDGPGDRRAADSLRRRADRGGRSRARRSFPTTRSPRDGRLSMVPEASLEQTESGLVPNGEGWYVLDAKAARGL